MSAATTSCNCNCATPEQVLVPGDQGSPGENGSNGINAFTSTTDDVILPASAGPVILPVTVGISSWASVGQVIFISDGTNWGHFQVTGIPSATSMTANWLQYPDDAAGAATINAPATVSPSGVASPLSAALPNDITDNSGGSASDTIASGSGVYTMAFPVVLAAVTGAGDVVTNLVISHRFQVISIAAAVTSPVTTGSRAATFNMEIGTTNVTGGSLALTSANCTPLGAVISGSAITGNDIGAAGGSISLEATSVTAFAEGIVEVYVQIRNLDTSDALATVSARINDLITSLTP